MDTKWKKSKMIAGLVTFVLGLCMLVGSVVLNPLLVIGNRADLSALLQLEGAYEKTAAFRDEICYNLSRLIAVGTQKNQNYIFSSSAYSYGGIWWGMPGQTLTFAEVVSTPYESAVMGQDEIAAAETEDTMEAVIEQSAAEGNGYEWQIGWGTGGWSDYEPEAELWTEGRTELTQKQTDRLKRDLEEEYGGNQNLLFELKKDGEVIFDNLDGKTLGTSPDSLPEGYGFLLVFDGNGVTLWQDGEEVDFFGDGMYEADGTHWCLPGYENYRLPEEWKECSVVMAARKTPVRMMEEGMLQGGSLYYVHSSYREAQSYFISWCARLVLGCLLLALSFLWKKDRKHAGERLGGLLGRAALEIRLVLAALWLYLIYLLLLYFNLVGQYGEISSFWWMADAGSLLAVLGIYLIGQRIKYGGRIGKNSLIGRLCRFLLGQEGKLDIQRRLTGRTKRVLAFLLAGILFLGIGLADNLFFWLGIDRYCAVLSAAAFLITFVLAAYNEYCQFKMAKDLGHLEDRINAAYDGTGREAFELPADSDLAGMAQKVAGIRDGLEEAVEERMKSERMKVELVANVSHDIKTPLTSIISYVDLMKEDENLPEELKDYVTILAQKSERLKEMVQDVFEVSKAASGQLPVQMQRLDLAKLMRQTLADMQEQIAAAPVNLKVQLPEDEVEIMADGQRLYRVFQNLLQNALQYSLEGSRVYVKLERQGRLAVTSIRNTSRNELDAEVDFTERFVRGDKSRTDGGSGLGLSIAKSFTEACGGTFRIETIADLFVATVEFGAAEPENTERS